MAATPVVAAFTYAHTIFCSDSDQLAVIKRFWTVYTIVGPAPDTQQCCDQLDALLAPLIKPSMNAHATYRGSTFGRVSDLPPLEVASICIANAGAGTGGADAMSKQTTGMLSLNTDLKGPFNRGRVYMPFPAVQADDGTGVPNAAYLLKLAAIGAIWTAFQTVVVGGNPTSMRCTRWDNDVHPTQPYTEGIARPAWATQKRRGDYGKANKFPI
jgi:hypothetical protein